MNANCAIGQDISGTWEVREVIIGNQELTPTSRWTTFISDSIYYSGNGWQQHTAGSYEIKNGFIAFDEKNGIDDPYGPFEILELKEDSMIWSRIEDGILVKVKYDRVNQLPRSPNDEVVGLWRLDSNSIHNNYIVHLRWDHSMITYKDGVIYERGYWNVNGHSAILTLINEGKPFDQWRITNITDSTINLEGISGNHEGKVAVYVRILNLLD